MRVLFFALFLLVLSPLVAQRTPKPSLQTFRDSIGLSMPEEDEVLVSSSADRAADLAFEGRLEHRDGQGRGAALQLLAQGYPPGEFGEILGAGGTLEAVWAAWLASPTHREVLETRGWTKWGWGSAPRGKTTVWVLRFWKP